MRPATFSPLGDDLLELLESATTIRKLSEAIEAYMTTARTGLLTLEEERALHAVASLRFAELRHDVLTAGFFFPQKAVA